MRSSGEALLSVINDILDFSKIEAGKLELEELDFDLRATLEDAAELLALRAHEKRLEFICRIDPEVPTFLRGDPGRLRQILINLGGNAIKFTARGEVAIEVRLESETDDRIKVRFEVRDTGIGIPQDKIGLLFTAFQQVDASTTRRFGGTGLGLAISKRLAELMGGEIGVESVEGRGSTFWFTAVFGKQPRRERRREGLRRPTSAACASWSWTTTPRIAWFSPSSWRRGACVTRRPRAPPKRSRCCAPPGPRAIPSAS